MKTYVIDSSVAVKWAFKEEYRQESIRYTNERLLRIAPDLILHECSSAIQKKVWRKEISPEVGWIGYGLIFNNNFIQLFNSKLFIRSAYELAVELNHAIYDCYYLALAK